MWRRPGQTETVDLLLNIVRTSMLQVIPDTGNAQITALDAAIWYGHPGVCKRLLEAGANPNRVSPSHGSALHVALTVHREEMAGWLLDHGADPFLEGGNPYLKTTPFELAITLNDGKLVPRMLSRRRSRKTSLLSQALSCSEEVYAAVG